MKKLFLILFTSISFSLFALPLSNTIVNALKAGNSGELAKFMDASIDLSIPGNEGAFSKTQSELILKTFFSKNIPSAFKIMHNGDAKNNTHYSIGNLTTTTGLYRVYILYKDANNANTILELRIEKDE